ncbi:hypothetical protein ACGRHY_29260 [Streptomyces sp. HK10]|uniref:hypothetical protein n=1 Tax=Streptomyces sp. HK10 TaxID=3373255 RepID=UPI003749D8B2
MTPYDGPAELLVDGNAYACRAHLQCWQETERPRSFGGPDRVQGLPGWGGTLEMQGDQPDFAWNISQAEDLRLRIGDREAAASVRPHDGGSLEITSNNSQAPFDCGDRD